MDLTSHLEHGVVALETAQDLHVLVELTAPDPTPAPHREPLRLAVVLDHSGSMRGHRLDAAKRCASYLAGQLGPRDALSIVAYGNEARLLQPLGRPDPAATGAALASLFAKEMTNLSAGWLKGYHEISTTEDGLRRVLLLTDGLANRGITDPARLAALAGQAAGHGVSTTTIGVGEGFDEDLLTAMADAGGGESHYAEGADDVPGIFAREFGDLATLVAQNLTLELRPSAAVTEFGLLNDLPVTETQEGWRIEIGDAVAGQRLRLVLALHIPGLTILGPTKVADLLLRWVAVGEDIAAHTVTHPLIVAGADPEVAATVTPDTTVTEEVVVLLAGRAMGSARERADAGDVRGASDLLDEHLARLRKVEAQQPDSPSLSSTIEELEATARTLRHHGYGPWERKRLHYGSRSLSRKRRR